MEKGRGLRNAVGSKMFYVLGQFVSNQSSSYQVPRFITILEHCIPVLAGASISRSTCRIIPDAGKIVDLRQIVFVS